MGAIVSFFAGAIADIAGAEAGAKVRTYLRQGVCMGGGFRLPFVGVLPRNILYHTSPCSDAGLVLPLHQRTRNAITGKGDRAVFHAYAVDIRWAFYCVSHFLRRLGIAHWLWFGETGDS